MEDSYLRWSPSSHHGGSQARGRPPPPGPPPPPPPSLTMEPLPQRWSQADESHPHDGNRKNEEPQWRRTSPPTRVLMLEHLSPSMATAAHVARSILAIDPPMVRSLQRTILVGFGQDVEGSATTSQATRTRPKVAFALFKSVEGAQYALDALRAQQLFQRRTGQGGGSSARDHEHDRPAPREMQVDFARFSSHFVRADRAPSPQHLEVGGDLWKTAWIDDDESGAAWQYIDERARCQEWKGGMPLPEDSSKAIAGQLASTAQQKHAVEGAANQKRPKDASSSTSLAAQAHLVGGKKKAAHDIANWAKKQEELHGGGSSSAGATATSGATARQPNAVSEMGPVTAPAPLPATQPIREQASLDVAPASTPSTASPDSSHTTAVESFTDARPTVLACYLCARRFKTAAILSRHQAESDLHRGNLSDDDKRKEARKRRRDAELKEQEAKAVEAGPERSAREGEGGGGGGGRATAVEDEKPESGVTPATASAATSPTPQQQQQSQYRDRALERRAAFGVDESALKEAKRAKRYHHPHHIEQQARTFVPGPEAPPASANPKAVASPPIEQPVGGRALDTSNVGHAMLVAMGWTAGSGLGEGERQGRVEPVEAALSHLGGEERAGIGASVGRGATTTTMAPGAGAWQTSMLEQAREARKRRYEKSGGGEEEKEAGAE